MGDWREAAAMALRQAPGFMKQIVLSGVLSAWKCTLPVPHSPPQPQAPGGGKDRLSLILHDVPEPHAVPET